MSLPVALTPGTVIGGHYVIGNLINRGGFGAVYQGIDKSEGDRPCAIKETYDVTPAARRQALMEASVLFTVRSKHLPEVYDALEANGRFYLVMQLIEGQNLLQLLQTRVPGGVVGQQEPFRLQAGPCSEQEVLSWLLPIMDVLQVLHDRNPPIMHRDIKPGNIILTPQNTTVLVDFGLTKLYDPNVSTQTMVKKVTEGFSPIEQYVGRTSPQSDIYSMAATLYLLLTNRVPPASIGRSVHDNLIPPRQLNPSITIKTERALLVALSLQADQRYQSMRAFAQALSEPDFAGYNDQTLASVPPKPSNAQMTTPSAFSWRDQTTPAPGGTQQQAALYQPFSSNVQQPLQGHTRSGLSMSGTATQPAQPGYSVPAPAYPYIPSTTSPKPTLPTKGKVRDNKKVTPAQSNPQSYKALPSAANQGCLWGLVQGVLSTLIVLTFKQQAAFYLAALLGFGFYVLAGYLTTRRGGSSLRGGWAGYWAGIYSTLAFWSSLGLSLAVLYVQRVQAISKGYRGSPIVISGRAWNAVLPAWPALPELVPGQQFVVNLLVLLLIGVALAWLLGWVGGLIGHSRRVGT